MEAPPGFEPGMEVLQTSALPLGDGAGRDAQIDVNVRPRMIPRSTALAEAGIERPDVPSSEVCP